MGNQRGTERHRAYRRRAIHIPGRKGRQYSRPHQPHAEQHLGSLSARCGRSPHRGLRREPRILHKQADLQSLLCHDLRPALLFIRHVDRRSQRQVRESLQRAAAQRSRPDTKSGSEPMPVGQARRMRKRSQRRSVFRTWTWQAPKRTCRQKRKRRTSTTIRSEAENAWNKELSVIDVSGGTATERTVFYTALYHSLLMPSIFSDVGRAIPGIRWPDSHGSPQATRSTQTSPDGISTAARCRCWR